MRIFIQRAKSASVKVGNEIVGKICAGLVVLVGVEIGDSFNDAKWTADKLVNMRIFADADDKMNLSALDINGDLLLISNFTLCGTAKKGNRPNFMNAERPEIANELFEKMLTYLRESYPLKVETGIFGAMMDVELVNDGPVSIWLESKTKL